MPTQNLALKKCHNVLRELKVSNQGYCLYGMLLSLQQFTIMALSVHAIISITNTI